MSGGFLLVVVASVVCCSLALPLDTGLLSELRRHAEERKDGDGPHKIEIALFLLLLGECELDARVGQIESLLASNQLRSLLARGEGEEMPSLSEVCAKMEEAMEAGEKPGEVVEDVEEQTQEKRDGPSGDGPSGERPSGDDPSGERPSGDRPSGECPSGERPSSDGPSGERPSGDGPSGERPSGDRPNGERPSGESPSGERPSGERPSGERQSGKRPSDERPNGVRPSGDGPSGKHPSGDRPSGKRPDRPSGDRPSGDRPNGGTPSGDRPSGARDDSGDEEKIHFAIFMLLLGECELASRVDAIEAMFAAVDAKRSEAEMPSLSEVCEEVKLKMGEGKEAVEDEVEKMGEEAETRRIVARLLSRFQN